jgi:hypothetical protein
MWQLDLGYIAIITEIFTLSKFSEIKMVEDGVLNHSLFSNKFHNSSQSSLIVIVNDEWKQRNLCLYELIFFHILLSLNIVETYSQKYTPLHRCYFNTLPSLQDSNISEIPEPEK